MKTYKSKHLLFLFLCFFCLLLNVKAGSANLTLGGNGSVYNGKTVEVTFALNSINATDGVMGVQFKIDYDSNYLQYVSDTSLAPFDITYNDSNKTIAGLDFSGKKKITGSSANLIKIVFKAKQEGTTAIKVNFVEVTEGNNDIANVKTASKSIKILPPPSTNANLANITLSNGSISFNKNTTNYNVSVDSDVTSINIGANAEDGGARVSGTGNKSLKYGDNTFKLVVTAASGDAKTYTVTVNRKDNRSSINTLKSLSVTNYNLSPNFNANTTTYNISVPFEVSQVNVSAVATDDKSTVKINGNNRLTAGRTTNITITVTAENGSVKTYTIKARRANDPNKVLSTNNFLASLTVSKGTLSPEFNKETTEYTVTVPTEVEEFKINANPSDREYGEVEINGPETLKIGENKYEIKVTAEDSSTKIYTVIVTREGDPEEPSEEEPTIIESLDLKSLTITNGNLEEDFDKTLHLYHYKKNGDIQIDAIAEDENNSVTVVEKDGVYTIMVENLEGELGVYTLVPTSNNVALIVTIVISFILIVLGFVLGYKIGKGQIKFSKKLNKMN